MRLNVRHRTTYRYESAVSYSIQTLHLSPRPHDGLAVLSWRIWADGRRELPSFVDGLGNLTHCLTVNRPHEGISLTVEGEVETTDMAGIIRGGAEPLPPLYYLQPTALTAPDPAIEAFAAAAGQGKSTIERLHSLMIALRERVDYQAGVTDTTTTAADALARGAGVCQDHAHIFIAGARLLGIPARYVGGYLWTGIDGHEYEASHAWAEAHIDHLGWVGFDPSNRICPTAAYIRTSVGLDYAAAAPARGLRRGDAPETLDVRVAVTARDADQ
jgi:transglutaminase-like putative cysteine protease